MSEATRLIDGIGKGDPRAAGELLPLVYEELRRLTRCSTTRCFMVTWIMQFSAALQTRAAGFRSALRRLRRAKDQSSFYRRQSGYRHNESTVQLLTELIFDCVAVSKFNVVAEIVGR